MTTALRALILTHDEIVAAPSRNLAALRATLLRRLGNLLRSVAPLRGTVAPATDQALLAAVRTGDRDAFDQLFVRYGSGLMQFAERQLGNVADAEDAVQEAMLELVRKTKETLPEIKSPRAYIFGFVRNRVLDAQRVALRADRPLELLDEPTQATDALDLAIEREDHERLAAALAKHCSVLEQEVLLADFDGLADDAIATRLGITTGHVRVLRHRARTKLQSALRRLT